jgi:hypothetical protein
VSWFRPGPACARDDEQHPPSSVRGIIRACAPGQEGIGKHEVNALRRSDQRAAPARPSAAPGSAKTPVALITTPAWTSCSRPDSSSRTRTPRTFRRSSAARPRRRGSPAPPEVVRGQSERHRQPRVVELPVEVAHPTLSWSGSRVGMRSSTCARDRSWLVPSRCRPGEHVVQLEPHPVVRAGPPRVGGDHELEVPHQVRARSAGAGLARAAPPRTSPTLPLARGTAPRRAPAWWSGWTCPGRSPAPRGAPSGSRAPPPPPRRRGRSPRRR